MFTPLIIGLIICIIFCVFYYKRKTFADCLPPGPPALPLLGNLLQIDRTDPRTTFVEWHKKYGPIFTVWLGLFPMVFVTDFDLMQEIFVNRSDEFVNRAKSYLLQFFTKGNYGISVANGDVWREQRRFTLHTLRNFGVGRKLMEEKIQNEVGKLLTWIDERLNGNKMATTNLRIDINLCVGNVISSLVLGRTFEPNDKKFAQLSRSLDKCFELMTTARTQLLNSIPSLRYVPLFNHFGYDELTEHVEVFLSFWYEELTKHKADIAYDKEPTDFTAAYLQEMERRKNAGEDMSHFSEWQLVCIMSDIWGAGMETTSTTLYWAFLLMMYHPDVQHKVQNEIDSVVGVQRCPNTGDRSEMPYTTAVLNEVQRYANILTSSIPRTSTRDVEIKGYKIPKDVGIVPQISVLFFDDTVFENARLFNPDRFLDDDGKTLKKYQQFIPFSIGKRACLGEGLARMELFLIFTSVLQKFSLSFVDYNNKPTLTPKIGITAAPFPYETLVSRRRDD